MKIREIAEFLKGEVSGDPEVEIYGFSSLEDAKKGDISFVAEGKYVKLAEKSEAACLIVSPDVEIEGKN
ncbi:UDP-3-O-(3-hydroxymyristoyl)glucosamine N-acyltransferase, partial [bacterium]